MECFAGGVNKIVGATKEYNMWRDDVWKDFPKVTPIKTQWTTIPNTSPERTGWIAPTKWTDAQMTSPETKRWVSPKKFTPPKYQPEIKYKTPEKSKNLPLDDLDTSPRTSTPVPDDSLEDIVSAENCADQYECFRVHLHDSPKKLKVRGADCSKDESMITGHINMKKLDPFSYTFEQHYMPNLNRCFVNLLINGPAPIMCNEHYDPNYLNNFVSNCHCVPICGCRVNLVTNRNLPIGYKYNEDGFVVSTVPSMPPRPHQRKANCIYTG